MESLICKGVAVIAFLMVDSGVTYQVIPAVDEPSITKMVKNLNTVPMYKAQLLVEGVTEVQVHEYIETSKVYECYGKSESAE